MNRNKSAVSPLVTSYEQKNAPRVFDTDRKHGVGQFLRAFPQAATTMRKLRTGDTGMFSLQQRASLK